MPSGILTRRRTAIVPAAAAGGGNYDSIILAEPSLTHYYKLNETAGATAAVDSQGGTNSDSVANVTFGSASLTSDLATSAAFNGTNSLIHFNSAIAPSTVAFSFEFFFRMNSLTLTRFFCVGTPFTSGYWVQVNSGGSLSFNSVGITFTSSGSIVINTTYHYVVAWDGAHAVQFLNGVNLLSSAISSYTAPTANTSFGARPDATSSLDGRMSKIAIYNAALNGTQVSAHYAAR